jgi:pimeloyl-ACP methyl ester carboxylesterase
VIGSSGGGPSALACAALLPERVDCAAVLVGLAPRDAAGLSWYAGMTAANRADYAVALRGADPLSALLEDRAAAARSDPAAMLRFLNPELPEPDRQVVADYGIRGMLEANFTEAFRESAAGWTDDTLAFISPWQFELASICAPVLFWHGEKDVFAPIGHSCWLASRIRDAALVVARGAAHFGALVVLPQVLCWLVAGGAYALDPSAYQSGT